MNKKVALKVHKYFRGSQAEFEEQILNENNEQKNDEETGRNIT